MEGYMPGVIISFITFMVLVWIDSQIFGSVMPFTLLFLLLVLHPLAFKALITEKKRVEYVLFAAFFAITLFFALPDFTQKQAAEKAVTIHSMDIIETETMLIDNTNPFRSSKAYFFSGENDGEKISVMVNPNTGKTSLLEN